jgi:hypothetical protein
MTEVVVMFPRLSIVCFWFVERDDADIGHFNSVGCSQCLAYVQVGTAATPPVHREHSLWMNEQS